MRPRWRSVGRRRPTPHRLRPKQSEGRRGNEFLVSRGMTAIPGPHAACCWGGYRQGKKVETRCCGIGGRGVSRPSGKSAHWTGRLELSLNGWQAETVATTNTFEPATPRSSPRAPSFQTHDLRTSHHGADENTNFTVSVLAARDGWVIGSNESRPCMADTTLRETATLCRGIQRRCVSPWPHLVRRAVEQISGPCNALSGLAGACSACDPDERRNADRAENRECDLPCVRWYEVFRDAMRRMAAGNGRRSDEEERDHELRPERANGSEQKLTNAEGEPGRKHAGDDAPNQPAPELNAHVPVVTPTKNEAQRRRA